MPFHRAILVVSVGQEKVQSLSKTQLLEKIRVLAKSLRAVSGVREVHAVQFTGWRDASRRLKRAPWTPHGAVVTVEASGRDALKRNIEHVWAAATKVDQEMMEFTPVDNWG